MSGQTGTGAMALRTKKEKETGIQVRMKPWVYDSAPPELKDFEEFVKRQEQKLKRFPIPKRLNERERAQREAEAYLKFKRKREARLARRFNWGRCLYETCCCYKEKPAEAYYIYQKWPTKADYKKQEALNAAKKIKDGGPEEGTCDVTVCTCDEDTKDKKHITYSDDKEQPEDSEDAKLAVCECPQKANKIGFFTQDQAGDESKPGDDDCVCSSSTDDTEAEQNILGQPGGQGRGKSGEFNRLCQTSICTCPGGPLGDGEPQPTVVDGVTCKCAVPKKIKRLSSALGDSMQIPPNYLSCGYEFSDSYPNEDEEGGESTFFSTCSTRAGDKSNNTRGSQYSGDGRIRFTEFYGENDGFDNYAPCAPVSGYSRGSTPFGDDPCPGPTINFDADRDTCQTSPDEKWKSALSTCRNRDIETKAKKRREKSTRSSTIHDKCFIQVETGDKKHRKRRQYSRLPSIIDGDECTCPSPSRDERSQTRMRPSASRKSQAESVCQSSPSEQGTCAYYTPTYNDESSRPSARPLIGGETPCGNNIPSLEMDTSQTPYDTDTCTCATSTGNEESSRPDMFSTSGDDNTCQRAGMSRQSAAQPPAGLNVCAAPPITTKCDAGAFSSSSNSSTESDNTCQNVDLSRTCDAQKPKETEGCAYPIGSEIESKRSSRHTRGSGSTCQSIRQTQMDGTCSQNTGDTGAFKLSKRPSFKRGRTQQSVQPIQMSRSTRPDDQCTCPPTTGDKSVFMVPERSTFIRDDGEGGQIYPSENGAEVDHSIPEIYGEYFDDLPTTTNVREPRFTTIPVDRYGKCVYPREPNERISRYEKRFPTCRDEEDRRDRTCDENRRGKKRKRRSRPVASDDDVDDMFDDYGGRDTPCQSRLPRDTACYKKTIRSRDKEPKTCTRSSSRHADSRRSRKSSQRENDSMSRRSRAASEWNDPTRESVRRSKHERKRESNF